MLVLKNLLFSRKEKSLKVKIFNQVSDTLNCTKDEVVFPVIQILLRKMVLHHYLPNEFLIPSFCLERNFEYDIVSRIRKT